MTCAQIRHANGHQRTMVSPRTIGAPAHLLGANPVHEPKTLMVQIAEQGVLEAKSGAGVTRGQSLRA